MKKISNKSGGFIQIVIIVVAALVLLKYVYDIDVVGFLTAGRFRGILDEIYNLGSKGWEKYSGLIMGAWSYIVDFVKNIASGTK